MYLLPDLQKRKQPEVYRYLFTTSKGIQGRIKCFVLEGFSPSRLISVRAISLSVFLSLELNKAESKDN